ncbi:hypothetical protein [uncultured Helicobacter sp.]|nr:hypothetical protein [uncultured Helicobacter sp.]
MHRCTSGNLPRIRAFDIFCDFAYALNWNPCKHFSLGFVLLKMLDRNNE